MVCCLREFRRLIVCVLCCTASPVYVLILLLLLRVSLRGCMCLKCESWVDGSQVCKRVQVSLAGLVVCGGFNFASPNSPRARGVPFVGGLSPFGASELQLQLQLLLLS